MTLSIVNWNVEWARKLARDSILDRIRAHSPEIVCLTETDDGLLSELGGYSIHPQCDFGRGVQGLRRKVMLWSREPWDDVDEIGDESLPPGRYISGITATSIGAVAMMGVCIPYHDSNRKQGKGQWEDHAQYLNRLAAVLRRKSFKPLIVLGDFNQSMGPRPYPPVWHPARAALHAALQAYGPPGLTVATAAVGFRGRRAIDHTAVSGDLCVESLCAVSNYAGEDRLSDHFGTAVQLSVQTRPI